MKGVAVIPARGGSVRLPRKNIKLLDGLPVIAHTIKLIKASDLFDEILVSSDDEEILDIAQEFGATITIKRAENLSGGQVPTLPVIQDALSSISIEEESPVCCVYPVNPLIFPETMDWTLKILQAFPQANYVSTVVRYGFPIQRSLMVNQMLMSLVSPEHTYSMSQDLEPRFHETGQFWWGKAKSWMNGLPMQDSMIGFELPEIAQQDVDNSSDWDLLELKFRFFSNQQSRENCLRQIPNLGINRILLCNSGVDSD